MNRSYRTQYPSVRSRMNALSQLKKINEQPVNNSSTPLKQANHIRSLSQSTLSPKRPPMLKIVESHQSKHNSFTERVKRQIHVPQGTKELEINFIVKVDSPQLTICKQPIRFAKCDDSAKSSFSSMIKSKVFQPKQLGQTERKVAEEPKRHLQTKTELSLTIFQSWQMSQQSICCSTCGESVQILQIVSHHRKHQEQLQKIIGRRPSFQTIIPFSIGKSSRNPLKDSLIKTITNLNDSGEEQARPAVTIDFNQNADSISQSLVTLTPKLYTSGYEYGSNSSKMYQSTNSDRSHCRWNEMGGEKQMKTGSCQSVTVTKVESPIEINGAITDDQ